MSGIMEADYLTVNKILEVIFAGEVKKFHHDITRLAEENDAYCRQISDGFNYLGTDYGKHGAVVYAAPNLHVELFPKMMDILKFRKKVVLDRQLIKQHVSVLIKPCVTNQDVRDALPESVVMLHDTFSKIPRTREEAWTIKSTQNQRALAMHERLSPLIEEYCAMQFLY